MKLVVEVGSVRAGGASADAGFPAVSSRPGAGRELGVELSGREFDIEQAQATIGRGAECDVVLAEHGVSRQHARIQYSVRAPDGTGERPGGSRPGSSGTWHLIDLGTTNGTLLNGHRIEAHRPEPLHVGDRVSIGGAVLVVRDLAAPGGAARGRAGLLGLHPAVRAAAALLFVAGLVAVVALLVIVLQPEPHVQETVLPTAASPVDVIATALPSVVPQELMEPLEQILTSQPVIPLLGTPEP